MLEYSGIVLQVKMATSTYQLTGINLQYQLTGSLEKKTLTLQEKIKFLDYADIFSKKYNFIYFLKNM